MLVPLSLVALPIICIAQVIPTAPGPGQTFMTGSECIIKWKPDTTRTWNSFDIDLMSGSNNNMFRVTNVVSNLDGTSSSSYSWTCPDVTPDAAIYFYQFNQKNASTSASHTWTTRFTILSETGGKTSPEHSRQPNGDPIPWGIGRLATTDEKLTKAHGGSVNLPSAAPATDRVTLSTSRHLQTSEVNLKTATPPEVTLNVPAPEPTRRARRNALKAPYIGPTHSNKFPCRCEGMNTLSGCRARLRNKPCRV